MSRLHPIPGQPGLFHVTRSFEGLVPPVIVAGFGPSIFNTPASRVAYVAEVNRRMIALDDAIRGTHQSPESFRNEWREFFRQWQVFVENSVGGTSQSFLDRLRQTINQWMPYTIVETANRFDQQWSDYADRAAKLGITVPIPKAKPLDEGNVNWEAIAISVAITSVAAWAIIKGPSFAKKKKPSAPKLRRPARGGAA